LCLLHWRPESDTHNINAEDIFKESRHLIGTAILGINKTLQTDKWTFLNVPVYRPVAQVYTWFLDISIPVCITE